MVAARREVGLGACEGLSACGGVRRVGIEVRMDQNIQLHPANRTWKQSTILSRFDTCDLAQPSCPRVADHDLGNCSTRLR